MVLFLKISVFINPYGSELKKSESFITIFIKKFAGIIKIEPAANHTTAAIEETNKSSSRI